jgi:hypothetical protein
MTEQTVSFWRMNGVVPHEVQQLIDQWKNMVSEKFEFEWNPRDDDNYVWNIWEYNNVKPLSAWKEMGRFIPPISFRFSGLNRYHTPIGTVWSIGLLPPPPYEWMGWTKLMSGALNRHEGWIPRLSITIGSTKVEDKIKSNKIMTERNRLPWNGQSWIMAQTQIEEPVEEGSVFYDVDLRGVSLNVLDEGETIDQEISDRLLQMEGKVSTAPVFHEKPIIPVENTTSTNNEEFPPLVTVPEGGRIQARTRQPWGPRSGNNSPAESEHENSQDED